MRGSLRVLVQLNSLALGGTQINAVDFAWGVRAHGIESVLVGPQDTLQDGPSLFDVAAARDVPLLAFERQMSLAAAARQLTELADAHGADLIHTYGTWSSRSAFWGPCRLARRPLVTTVYEMEVLPSVYRGPTLVVGTGYLMDEQRGRRGPVALISPPVDLERDDADQVDWHDFVKSTGIDPASKRLVIVSRLDDESLRPVKITGVELAISAVAAMRGTDLCLLVVGTGNALGRVQELAARVNQDLGRLAVVVTGPLADPRPAYACADVVAGMGGSAARGLAFGKPLVVLGEFGGTELFTLETSRTLFRNSFWDTEAVLGPQAVAALAHTLDLVLASDDQIQELGAFGREFASRNFSLTAMSQRLAAVYRSAGSRYRPMDWGVDLPLEASSVGGGIWRRLRFARA